MNTIANILGWVVIILLLVCLLYYIKSMIQGRRDRKLRKQYYESMKDIGHRLQSVSYWVSYGDRKRYGELVSFIGSELIEGRVPGGDFLRDKVDSIIKAEKEEKELKEEEALFTNTDPITII